MEKDRNIVCLKSELDLFHGTNVQLGVESSSFVEIHPLASLSENTPVEFFITGNSDFYLDLSHTLLNLKISIQKNDGTNLIATDEVSPVNYLLQSIFSECSVFLNDKQIASQVNYSYRAILESLLFYSKSAQDSLLTSALFCKDTAGQHDVVGANSTNEGYKTRKERSKLSKQMDLIGFLHFDLATQPKLLINGVSVKIKLERNKNSFCLMSASDNYKLHIHSASLFVRKVNVASSIMLAHERALDMGVIKMPIRRVDVKTFALASGLRSTTIANAFMGQLPARMILAFVSNEAYNGDIKKNPFKFSHYDLSYLCILNDGIMYPSKPYSMDFSSDVYARGYLSLFTDLNRFHTSPNININFEEYKNNYSFWAFDISPDFQSGSSHASINKSGNISIDLKFQKALPETVTLIVYGEYRNTIEIDKSRGVFIDY